MEVGLQVFTNDPIVVPEYVEYNGQRVLTTEQLAEFYGVEPRRITENFRRNEEYFTEEIHYFKLEGEALKTFKNQYAESVSVGARTASLILWTKQGAFRHAKMLTTDRAWEVYEALEDTYFDPIKNLTPKAALDFIIQQATKDLEMTPEFVTALISPFELRRAQPLS